MSIHLPLVDRAIMDRRVFDGRTVSEEQIQGTDINPHMYL